MLHEAKDRKRVLVIGILEYNVADDDDNNDQDDGVQYSQRL